jgi:hypothetical protein
VKHLEEALERNERAGFAPQAAHSVYELGAVLSELTSPQSKQARALFARVLEMSRRMGMAPLMRAAQDHLRSG